MKNTTARVMLVFALLLSGGFLITRGHESDGGLLLLGGFLLALFGGD